LILCLVRELQENTLRDPLLMTNLPPRIRDPDLMVSANVAEYGKLSSVAADGDKHWSPGQVLSMTSIRPEDVGKCELSISPVLTCPSPP